MATAIPPPPAETAEGHAQQPAPEGPQAPNVASGQAPVPLFSGDRDPDDLVETQKTLTLKEKVQAFRARYATAEMAAFFFAGFLYDVFTLSRIDDGLSQVQQGAYLTLLGTLLCLEQRWSGDVKPSGWLAKGWRFSEDVLHFFFGSLLSTFVLFFFKSASGFSSLLFLLVVFGLLVVNELPRFRAMGPVVRVALFSFCITSYFAYVLPVAFHKVNAWLFLSAVVLGCGAVTGLFFVVRRWNQGDPATVFRRIAVPGLAVQGGLLLLYLLNVIPPVPLALQHIGIYHHVEVVKGPEGKDYLLSHERPDWKYWHHGDQDFHARPGDKAWCFVRIFAPAGFQDRITFRWSYDDPHKGWVERSKFSTALRAGWGERGFRTMASQSYLSPGDWRVSVETEDGREIGNMSFTVIPDGRTGERKFKVDMDKGKPPAGK